MAWIVPTARRAHPCILPDQEERKTHRPGELHRCEVCTDLWILRKETTDEYPYPSVERWLFYRVHGWAFRWRYRKEGYSNGPATDPGLPTD